jgi:hypothetical protein
MNSPTFRRLFLLVTLLVLSTAIAAGIYSRGRQSKPKSLTDSVEIVEKIAGDGATKIAFRNVSNKNINALQLAVSGSVFTVEFLDADESKQKLPPGEIYQEWFPTTPTSGIDVSVLAVVFDDKTGAGDSRLVQEVLETRRGVKKQLMRFGVLLRQSLASANIDGTTLDKLTAQIDKSVEDAPSDSGAVRLGQRKAKQQIRHDLEALERQPSNGNIRIGLTLIEERHAKRLAELQ